jgi:hypothetical protein
MKKLVLENFLPHWLSRVSSAVSRDSKLRPSVGAIAT